MGEIVRLVQDVVHLYAKNECSDAFVDFGIPLPFRLAVSGRIAIVKDISKVRVELQLMLGGVGSVQSQPGVQRVQIDARIQGVTGDMALRIGGDTDGIAIPVVFQDDACSRTVPMSTSFSRKYRSFT